MQTFVEIGPSKCFARDAQKKGRKGAIEKSDTRLESNPGPRLF